MPAVRVIAALQGKEVHCKEKSGVFEGCIIRCKCCNKEFAPSAFEHHSGSSFRRPWKCIKDSNGKSIQQYRDEQETEQEVETKPPLKEDTFVVERIISSRMKQGKKEYLVKWENYGSPHNSWIPPENFGNHQIVEEYENQVQQERKRKVDVLEKASPKIQKFSHSAIIVGNESYGETSPPNYESSTPPSNSFEWNNSSPPNAFGVSSEKDPTNLEPLFEESSLEEVGSSPKIEECENQDEDEYGDSDVSDDEDEDPPIIPTISVDYEGMKGIFIQVSTFKELLQCALEYWEMNELTSPKDWVLTNEKGAMWPLHESTQTYSPEVVYLKRKPWR